MPAPRLITYRGRTRNIRQWSRETGIHPATLKLRLDSEKPLDAVFRPVRKETKEAEAGFDDLVPGCRHNGLEFVRYVEGHRVRMALFRSESGWLETFTEMQYYDPEP